MLKVGDKVRFTGECCDHNNEVCFNDTMKKLLRDGKDEVYTIKRVSVYSEDTMIYKLEEIDWTWTDKWIKRVAGTNIIGGKVNAKGRG